MPQEAGGVALMGEESPDGCSMLGMVIVPFPGEGLVPGSLGDSSVGESAGDDGACVLDVPESAASSPELLQAVRPPSARAATARRPDRVLAAMGTFLRGRGHTTVDHRGPGANPTGPTVRNP
ncbi:hypothetical protein CYJ76_07945 [Kytococcus schroeteri]|uniref:Uncharacterized protein n=1 Tax=Kytococcus schroeteri TaxID=138300 RepID=A0A2I1P9N7_9MICO|nr:hypothetical protein CYJ76_07945 [Kytococcus schroeteri]